ncbi:MAG: radical SAM protein [Pedobacter sp.]|nr:radical SAM protein [Pedobacter sp.]
MKSLETLFVISQDKSYNTTDTAAKLEGLQAKKIEEHYDPEFVQEHIDQLKEQGSDDFSFDWYPHNVPGNWMSSNITTPNTVVTEPITVQKTAELLDAGTVGALVVATYLSGYSEFRDIVSYVRKAHPKTKIIGASVGALLAETEGLTDAIVTGDQVHDLRKALGEKVDTPLQSVIVRAETTARFNGAEKQRDYGLLISSLGCMYGCDFCPSTAQFGNKYEAPFTALQIKQSIIAAHDEISPESDRFTISVAEPQGLGNKVLWKEVLKICKDLPFTCDLITTTSSKVIQGFSLEELTEGALRLTTVNIGVESLLRGYRKNKNVDLKELNSRLQGAGISVVSTFIVGFDWHDKGSVREEVKLLKDLNSDGYIVANLEMQPGTPIFNHYLKNGRIATTLPAELLNFYGFQAFKHPNFAMGFNDMLPLLSDIEAELSDGTQIFGANLRTYLNRKNNREASSRQSIVDKIRTFQQTLDPLLSEHDAKTQTDKYSAALYFKDIFQQIDLFHPFILSTN